jgi:hypothetical protein
MSGEIDRVSVLLYENEGENVNNKDVGNYKKEAGESLIISQEDEEQNEEGQEKAVTLQEEINQMEDTELADEQIKADGDEIKVQPIQTSKQIKADGNEIEVEPIQICHGYNSWLNQSRDYSHKFTMLSVKAELNDISEHYDNFGTDLG